MRYFTRERYLALQNDDPAAVAAADADWEASVEQYDAYLESIRSDLPASVRELLDGFYLHDANVLSMARRGDEFVVGLQLDVPPQDVLTITYTLVGEPRIRQEALPGVETTGGALWLYEELEWVGSPPHYVHSILLSNGWEIDLPFQSVEIAVLKPVFPTPGIPSISLATTGPT